MGAIKDIVDLIEDLETRAKDRRDIDLIHKLQSLVFSLQGQHADIIERDVRLMEENAELKRQLAKAQTEEFQFHSGVEFRRGKKTGGKWMAFCTKCHLPAAPGSGIGGKRPGAVCSANCGWSVFLSKPLDEVIKELEV